MKKWKIVKWTFEIVEFSREREPEKSCNWMVVSRYGIQIFNLIYSCAHAHAGEENCDFKELLRFHCR